MEMNSDINDHIKSLIIGHLRGLNTYEESQDLKKWIDEDVKNRENLEGFKLVWLLTDKASEKPRFDNDKLWVKLKSRLDSHEDGELNKIHQVRKFSRILKIAASWLIIFMAGSTITFLFTKPDFYLLKQSTTITTPLGAKSQIELPDGSSVWLNAGSKLEYKGDFNSSTREVKLQGEGFFNVTTNKSKPFIVNADQISIKAFGTSFNVKAYPEEKMVTTTLVEGEVEIEGIDEKNNAFTISLDPKQKVTYFIDNKSFAKNQEEFERLNSEMIKKLPVQSANLKLIPAIKDINVKTELYTSWKDKSWIIEGENFGNLVIMLNRRYNVLINLESKELENYRFSGIIENETIEQVFGIMRLTIPMDYSIDTGKVFIRLDRKLQEKYKSAYY